MTTPLSPAAQAVLDAFAADNYGVWLEGDPERLAAALKAAADQVEQKLRGFSREACQEIRAIADELEAH